MALKAAMKYFAAKLVAKLLVCTARTQFSAKAAVGAAMLSNCGALQRKAYQRGYHFHTHSMGASFTDINVMETQNLKS